MIEISKIVKKISLLHSTSTETPTIFALAVEIIGCIPINWSNPNLKILDPACGRGTFLLAVMNVLEKAGHDRKHIIENMLYGVDLSKVQAMIAKKAFNLVCPGARVNIYCENSLTKVWNMKFDVMVGNPPFEATDIDGRKDQANNLWSKFTKKGIELLKDGGHLAFITPTSWLSPAADIGKGKTGIRFFTEYFQKFKVIALNVNECAKHFSVGSTFSYFVLEKTPAKKFITKVTTADGSYDIDLRSIYYLPKSMNQLAISINKKVLSSTSPFGFVGNNLPETKVDMKKEPTATHQEKAYHTGSKGGTHWYCEKPIKTAESSKVIVSLSGNYIPVYDNSGMSFTGMCVVYYLEKNDSMDSIKSFLDSKLVKFILNENKYTGWVSSVISVLPNIDKNRIWTEQELYSHFNLTNEEIQYIEDHAK